MMTWQHLVMAICIIVPASISCSGGGGEHDGASPSPSALPASSTIAIASPTSAPTGTVVPPTAIEFRGETRSVSESERAAMLASGSWREGCPVPIDDLRVLELSYWDFEGNARDGVLMVNADVADPVIGAFRALFDARFPVYRMDLVDAFGADDEQSMLADNTSAYNCRGIPGSSAWSQHAYGLAVDINPFENPEVRAGNVDPPQAARFADRTLREQGMIHPGDAAVRAFATIGWYWGGDWDEPKDYQHFSLTGN